MSSQQAPGKQALIAELVHKTHFSTQSIFQMSRKFKLIAGASKSVISFDEFRQIMSEDVGDLLVSIGVLGAGDSSGDGDGDDGDTITAAGSSTPSTPDMSAIGATISSSETFLRRLFLTFDVDGDGKIDFREFVVGLNGFVKGSPEEKVHALFEIYKSDDDTRETVAISDLLGLFQGDRHLYQELMWCVDEYFARVELRDELQPTMTEDEFVAASVAEPHLLDMVSRPVPSRRYASEAHVRDKVRAFIEQKQLNWKKLLAIHRRMVDSTRSLSTTTTTERLRTASTSSALTSLPATPRTNGSDAPKCSEALAIPVAAFHEILTTCLGPTPSGDDEALTQSILLAYVATPREKLSTPQQQQAPVHSAVTTPSGDDALERRDKPVRRACTLLLGALSLSTSLACCCPREGLTSGRSVCLVQRSWSTTSRTCRAASSRRTSPWRSRLRSRPSTTPTQRRGTTLSSTTRTATGSCRATSSARRSARALGTLGRA